jgi:hypothetical protein
MDETKSDFIEMTEEQLEDMFKFLIDPTSTEEELPSGFGFDTLYGEDFYAEKFPGFSKEAYEGMALNTK